MLIHKIIKIKKIKIIKNIKIKYIFIKKKKNKQKKYDRSHIFYFFIHRHLIYTLYSLSICLLLLKNLLGSTAILLHQNYFFAQ